MCAPEYLMFAKVFLVLFYFFNVVFSSCFMFDYYHQRVHCVLYLRIYGIKHNFVIKYNDLYIDGMTV